MTSPVLRQQDLSSFGKEGMEQLRSSGLHVYLSICCRSTWRYSRWRCYTRTIGKKTPAVSNRAGCLCCAFLMMALGLMLQIRSSLRCTPRNQTLEILLQAVNGVWIFAFLLLKSRMIALHLGSGGGDEVVLCARHRQPLLFILTCRLATVVMSSANFMMGERWLEVQFVEGWGSCGSRSVSQSISWGWWCSLLPLELAWLINVLWLLPLLCLPYNLFT